MISLGLDVHTSHIAPFACTSSRTLAWSKVHFHKGLDMQPARIVFVIWARSVGGRRFLLLFDLGQWKASISTRASNVSFSSNEWQDGGCPVWPSPATSLATLQCLALLWFTAFPFNIFQFVICLWSSSSQEDVPWHGVFIQSSYMLYLVQIKLWNNQECKCTLGLKTLNHVGCQLQKRKKMRGIVYFFSSQTQHS